MKRILVALLVSLCPTPWALALESFTVRDIRVEGLQRIAAGTVFNYLPIKVGDTVTDQHAQDAIRSLHKTGFFKDVRLERQGEVLIVTVVERPSIGGIHILGTKEMSEEDLKKGLKEIGLAEGRVYNKSLLDRVEQELRQQYFSRGFYAVVVRPTITPLERNRVDITIDVSEGKPARIREVNLVGNQVFTDDELLEDFTQGPAAWWALFSSRDQYSKQKLAGDLERLRNYYQDRGYLEFTIDSTQVSITPSKDHLYVTINMSEGKKYTLTGFKLAGKFVVPEEELKALVTLQPGSVFSRRQVTEATKKITDRLTNEGYAFANVNAIPEINREKSEVFFTFFIDPGKRTYVRRVNFSGNVATRDDVLRREMRQLESGWYSAEQIQRSKVRLQRLGFFEDVNVETPAVPGTQDQVDMNVSVKERATGNLLFGVGYSDADGLLVNASVTQRNWFGTGRELTAAIDRSASTKNLNLRYVNPYATQSGISQGYTLYDTRVDSAAANTAAYNTDTRGLGTFFGIPLSEDNTLHLGVDYERIHLITTDTSAKVAKDFVAENGPTNDLVKTTLGWSKDTLDSLLLPSEGATQRINLEASIPGSDIGYYKITYAASRYWPWREDTSLRIKGELGYGDGYGDTHSLPFYKNYYAGGSNSIRGYKSRSLGPRDENPPNDPIGGNKRVLGNIELFFPVPGAAKESNKSMRLSLFGDTGMVYGPDQPVKASELRASYGLAFNWFSPVGPLSFSYAIPVRDQPQDNLERFQFNLGVPFR
jgi:outer membrane protein insertion porin family